jgi:alpha-2-macroglobulin
MRRFMALAALAVGWTLALAPAPMAQDAPLVPTKRMALSQDVDLPGGDLASAFDTTLEACERACFSNDRCTAFTFNTRNGSCFSKASPGAKTAFQGAMSGIVLTSARDANKTAELRRQDLDFASDSDIATAYDVALAMGRAHLTNGYNAEELLQAASEAETRGDAEAAMRFNGAAVVLSDLGSDWAEYARRLMLASKSNSSNRNSYVSRAYSAALNAYLRATNPALQHNILIIASEALEQLGRGSDMVQALRLAQRLQPRDDTAKALDTAIGKYGFRITENTVDADSPRPRLCATFSEELAKSGVDYESFVQLPASGLSVTSDGYRTLCIEGLEPGARYTVTFREGLPAANGQTMAKSVPISAYIRDRAASARFPGRGYVLPKGEGAAIPVETVNTTKLDLTLYRVNDRNLLRAIQNDYLRQPLAEWQEEGFSDQVGNQIWKGTATVGQEVNKDVTTRLPMAEALKGQPAGVYALKAAVPGQDSYEHPPAWQWFVVSDLGLTTMSGVDGLHVFVRSLGSATAVSGASVELLSTANEVLATVATDGDGYARFDAGLTRGTGGQSPALVVVKLGEDLAFLSLSDPEFDLSDRGVEGREAAPPVDVFLTTDRGAYRAGETVYATALARDTKAEAVAGLPLTAVLKRPDGVEYSRQLVADGGAGGHVFALPVAGAAPRGVWRLEVLADLEAAPLAAKTFLVEDFLPERIDFDLSLDDQPLRLGDAPELTVQAKYLFGAPGADLAIEGEVLLRAAKEVPGFPGYSFGRYDEPFSAQLASFDGDRTDESGNAVIAAALPEVEDPARPLEARFTVRVAEGSGRPVERQITKLLTPSSSMIGIKPLFDEVVPEGADARFDLIGLDDTGKATDMAVKWTLSRIETNYQWYQAYGNWNWEPVTSRVKVNTGTAQLGVAPLEIASAVQWGEYELLVESTDGSEAVSSTTFYAGWYAPADVSSTPDTLELSLDKPAYKPGDTATLRIVPRAAGTALVTVLSNRLVAMKAVEVHEGENLIPLDVSDEWGAGVYVTASVLRPMDVAAGRNPARALGLAHAAIDPGTHKLSPVIEVADEVAPRGPMDIAVKVNAPAGEIAYVTIAAVDQGILNLTGFTAPDPAGYYFGQRKLGVGIRDVYGRLIDGMNGAEGTVRSGGDAGAQARLQAPPPTEELVAYFAGPVKVGEDGYARTSFDLPSFNGSVKVMAIAWTAKAVGQADKDVLVRDPVVVTASLPRFMAPGDESRLLLEIVHATGPSGRMGLDVVGRGVSLGAVPSGFDLADKGKAVFAVPIKAGEAGLQSIDVALTTPDGKTLTKTLTLPVQANDPEVSHTSRLTLAAGQTLTFDQAAFSGMLPGSGKATMAIGPLARINAPGLLAALDRYPYGCTEQITSKAMPLLYFDSVAMALGLKGADNIHQRIDQAVQAVLTNQSAEGAFGLWSPASGDLWLDAYVTDFLSRARAQGYAVPDQAFRQALDNLRNQVNYAPDFDQSANGGGENLAYALMVLAREGAAAIGDLRYYADVKGDAFRTALAQAQLGAALASYGDQPRADTMFRKAAARTDALMQQENAQLFRADFGTNYRDAAALLTLAVESGSQVLDREKLTSRISTNVGFLSTQEATWALMAANALIDRPGAEGIEIDGAPATGPLVQVLTDSAPPVSVANKGSKDTQLTLTTYGIPEQPEPAGGNGYAIARSYYTLEGEETTLDGVTVGDRLVTVITVTPFGKGEARLMVADPLPAGFEIDNPNLISGGSLANLDWLGLEQEVSHTEFRQDRFLAAVDRGDGAAFKLAYIVRAVSPGTFHHPAASVEDMYGPNFRAHSDAGTVTIAE